MRHGARIALLAIGISIAAASVSATPAHADTVVDNVSDWFATIGKKDMEKQAILTERKAKREAAKLQRATEKQAKQAEKQARKAGKDMQKGLNDLTN
jgi:hypothetical protein